MRRIKTCQGKPVHRDSVSKREWVVVRESDATAEHCVCRLVEGQFLGHTAVIAAKDLELVHEEE